MGKIMISAFACVLFGFFFGISLLLVMRLLNF